MGAVIMGMVAVAIIATAFWPRKAKGGDLPPDLPPGPDDKKDRLVPNIPIKPWVPDAPDPGAGKTNVKCPQCGVLFVIQNGTMLQPHPPCPWPNKAPIEPMGPSGPDPLKPTPKPTPGFYYQVKSGDVPSTLAHGCYPLRPKPMVVWMRVAAHPRNAWMLGHPNGGIESGGFWPQWSGWGSKWASGHQFGVVYWPTPEELDA